MIRQFTSLIGLLNTICDCGRAESSFSSVCTPEVEEVGKVGRLPPPEANISSRDTPTPPPATPPAPPPHCRHGEFPADTDCWVWNSSQARVCPAQIHRRTQLLTSQWDLTWSNDGSAGVVGDVRQSPCSVVGYIRQPPVADHVEVARVAEADGAVRVRLELARDERGVHLEDDLLAAVHQQLQRQDDAVAISAAQVPHVPLRTHQQIHMAYVIHTSLYPDDDD